MNSKTNQKSVLFLGVGMGVYGIRYEKMEKK
jgi:hypothetical protein